MDLPEPVIPPNADSEWHAQYQFYRKIMTDEVERLRFNDGLEPVEVDLYPVKKDKEKSFGPDFVGTTQIGHQKFQAVGKFIFTATGKALRVTILAQPPK